MRHLRTAVVALAICATSVRVTNANPSVTPSGSSPFALLLLFPLEGVIIAALAHRKSAVRWIRFVGTWTGVTLVTYVVLLFVFGHLMEIVRPPSRLAWLR
jgi:hypothetical protein